MMHIRSQISRPAAWLTVSLIAGSFPFTAAFGAETSRNAVDGPPPIPMPKAGWFQRVEAGFTQQFEADADSGGDFEVSRFISRATIGYRTDFQNSTALSISYGRDDYDFSDFGGFAAATPWDEIHTAGLGMVIRRSLSDRWSVLAIPSVRLAAEDQADIEDSLTGGAIAGFSYTVSPKLTIGPGFGAITQLEDSTAIFPVIIVNWQISPTWKLETGRGLGASLGPGLLLTHSVSESWDVLFGGRFDRRRFRLSREGVVPDGVGEERSAPVYLGVRYNWPQSGSVALFGGANLAGKLQLDNPDGNELVDTEFDTAPFVGLSASFRF